jgi:hypothetical protein
MRAVAQVAFGNTDGQVLEREVGGKHEAFSRSGG